MDYSWVQYPLLLRSVLYVPADNARALEKSIHLAADALIFDLEDAVLPDKKVAAREALRSVLSEAEFGYRKVLVRVNSPDSEDFNDDIAALEGTQVNGLVLPKVECADAIEKVQERLGHHDLSLPLWLMIETPKGVLAAPELADNPDVEALVAGTQDLARALRLPDATAREVLMPYLAQIVLAARASDAMVFDGIYRDYKDMEGFAAECEAARRLGFDGKTLIHPAMLEPANRIFTPTRAEVDKAKQVVQAAKEAEQAGKAITVVDGRMIEPLHAELAKEIVRKADMAERRAAEQGGEA